jgi:hypothetical protein
LTAIGWAKAGCRLAVRYNQCMKECPLCGDSMRLVEREVSEHLPGHVRPKARLMREWVCPECDYFEEADAGEE